MRTILILIMLCSCGAPTLEVPGPSCPTSPAANTRCCESEAAEVRCAGGTVWYCDSLHRDDAGVLEFFYWQPYQPEVERCR